MIHFSTPCGGGGQLKYQECQKMFAGHQIFNLPAVILPTEFTVKVLSVNTLWVSTGQWKNIQNYVADKLI